VYNFLSFSLLLWLQLSHERGASSRAAGVDFSDDWFGRRCAVPLAAGITAEVRRIIADADGGRGIPPALMTDIQGGLGTLYTLINAHGADMAAAEGEGECLQDAALLLLDILQVGAFMKHYLFCWLTFEKNVFCE
jgi:hypothetical protein